MEIGNEIKFGTECAFGLANIIPQRQNMVLKMLSADCMDCPAIFSFLLWETI
jgi:hypothetical protein